MDGRVTPEEQAAALAGRLLRVMPRVQQWAGASLRASRAEGDPSFRQLAALYLILGGAASPSLLAERMGISRAVVTGLLDRMEERGLVRREPDPDDRRRLRVAVTAAGAAAAERLGRGVARELGAQLAREGEDGLAALAAALPVVERALDALHGRTPQDPLPASDGDPWDEPPATTRSAVPFSMEPQK